MGSSNVVEPLPVSSLSRSNDSEDNDSDTISHSTLEQDRVKEDQPHPLKKLGRVTVGDREERGGDDTGDCKRRR